MRAIKNRIASRTLIERGDVGRGAIRRAAAVLRHDMETTGLAPSSLRNMMRYQVKIVREDITQDLARGKYRLKPAA